MFLRPVNQVHEVVDLTVGDRAQHVDLRAVPELRRELLEQVRQRVAEPLRVLEAVGVGAGAARILDLLLARPYLRHVAREGAPRAPETHLESPRFPPPPPLPPPPPRRA